MYNSLDFLKDFVILPGGSDINPAIYGKENYKSHINEYSIQRDKNEIEEYHKAVKEGRCIYGVCRGLSL